MELEERSISITMLRTNPRFSWWTLLVSSVPCTRSLVQSTTRWVWSVCACAHTWDDNMCPLQQKIRRDREKREERRMGGKQQVGKGKLRDM